MRFRQILFCLLLTSPAGLLAQKARVPLEIIPAQNAWKGASIADVKKILYSAADELWQHAYDREIPPIIVNNGSGGPIVYYKRGREGQYRVKLDTGNTYWSQYAFQFSHEFCHIMCRYKDADKSNLWFEETLCETASLYALRAMSETWAHRPPYSNWKDYRHSLRKYAQERIDEHRIDKTTSLADWYREHADHLRTHSTDRPKNTAVAIEILPLFERQPKYWAAVSFINQGRTKDPQDFKTYLNNWRSHCPEEYKPLVTQILNQFELRGPIVK